MSLHASRFRLSSTSPKACPGDLHLMQNARLRYATRTCCSGSEIHAARSSVLSAGLTH